MKALEKLNHEIANKLNTPFVIKRNDNKVKINDFQQDKDHYILELGALNLKSDNYRIFLKGHYLTLIVSEIREISKPLHVHNMTWHLYKQQAYEVMKSIDIWLPGNNFYLVRHFVLPEDQTLKIILGTSLMN